MRWSGKMSCKHNQTAGKSFGRSFSTGQCAEIQQEAELSQMLAARKNLLVRASPAPLTPQK